MLTDDDIERQARALRKELGIAEQLRPDMMTVIQKTKSLWKENFGYIRVADEKMPDAEAQWDSDEKRMSLREAVFVSMQKQEPRARMTVAHELGHFALKHSGVRNRSTTLNAAEKYLARVKREEWEARRFAAAFLAPAEMIAPEDTAEDIAARFGISTQAADIRRLEVQEMRLRESRQTRALPSNVVDYLREAQRRGYAVQTKLD